MNDASLVARHPQRLTLDVLGMYVRERGAQLWAGGLVQLLGDLGFSVGAARVAVQRLCARGLLE
ncbi:MAG: PaaX family transcriptional regulator C-terminal domain-containing protein, partial [Candidatus Dormibacteraceae bacterium]